MAADRRLAAVSPLRLVRVLDAPAARTAAASGVMVAAVLSPNIGLPDGLPAIRVEQILAILLIPAMVRIHARDRALRRLDLVDFGFAAVLLSVAISVILAPAVVPSVGRSYRDVFQLLRPVEYWILYRLGRATLQDRPVEIGHLFAAFAIFGGILGLLQAVGGEVFNTTVTAIWAGDHGLGGVAAARRIVGSVGNANLFGLWSGWLGLSAVAVVFARDRIDRRIVLLLAAGLAAMTLVLSQSRSAGLGTFGAAGLMAVLLLARGRMDGVLRRDLRRLALAAAAVGAGAVVAAAVLLLPGGSASARSASRFDLGNLTTDASVVERVAILRFAFGAHQPDAIHALICDGPPAGTPSPGHEPAGPPASPAAASATTRSVIDAARLVEAGYCASGVWSMPATSAPGISMTADDGGYVLEAASTAGDPASHPLVLTSHPNLVSEPSLEAWPSAQWHVTRDSTVASGPARFGTRSTEVSLAPGGVFDQYVLYMFAKDAQYTGSIEARSADGADHPVTLSFDAWLVSGSVIAPIREQTETLPADGSWVRLAATFRTPAAGQVWVARVLVYAPDAPATMAIDLDGASLVAGSSVPTFEFVRDVDPAVLPSTLPSFWDSPVVGIGPMSNIEFGSFDNEYALTLFKFGALGMAALLLVYLGLITTGLRAYLRRPRERYGLSGLALAAGVLAAMVYGIAAGVWYSFQLMAILSVWAGIVAAGRAAPVEPKANGPLSGDPA